MEHGCVFLVGLDEHELVFQFGQPGPHHFDFTFKRATALGVLLQLNDALLVSLLEILEGETEPEKILPMASLPT
jgi:hypothetical protein